MNKPLLILSNIHEIAKSAAKDLVESLFDFGEVSVFQNIKIGEMAIVSDKTKAFIYDLKSEVNKEIINYSLDRFVEERIKKIFVSSNPQILSLNRVCEEFNIIDLRLDKENISLRDEFAKIVLKEAVHEDIEADKIGKMCYSIADKMILARNK